MSESLSPEPFTLEVKLMDKPKKNPILTRHNVETKLCLNCGFPNRKSDKRCMYCKTSILEESGIIAWIFQVYYILRWRWQLKQNQKKLDNASTGNLSPLKFVMYFVAGVILGAAGLYLFANAVMENSFSSGLIAVLFAFYGIITLKSLFMQK